MKGKYDLSTKEGREAQLNAHQAEIKKLQEVCHSVKSKIDKLDDDNAENISERVKTQKSLKSKLTWGIVLCVIGCVFLLIGLIKLHVVIIGLGVVMTLGGILLFISRIRNSSRLKELNESLKDYDEVHRKLFHEWMENDDKITEYEEALDEIRRIEKYEEVDRWIETISTGYVGLYVTSEYDILSDRPKEPVAKEYTNYTFENAQVYLNDMVYGNLYRAKGGRRSFEIYRGETEGTQKMQIALEYEIANSRFDWASQPIPVRLGESSKFVWCHISTCQKGTHVYAATYDNMELFLEETGITKDELIDMFL